MPRVSPSWVTSAPGGSVTMRTGRNITTPMPSLSVALGASSVTGCTGAGGSMGAVARGMERGSSGSSTWGTKKAAAAPARTMVAAISPRISQPAALSDEPSALRNQELESWEICESVSPFDGGWASLGARGWPGGSRSTEVRPPSSSKTGCPPESPPASGHRSKAASSSLIDWKRSSRFLVRQRRMAVSSSSLTMQRGFSVRIAGGAV